MERESQTVAGLQYNMDFEATGMKGLCGRAADATDGQFQVQRHGMQNMTGFESRLLQQLAHTRQEFEEHIRSTRACFIIRFMMRAVEGWWLTALWLPDLVFDDFFGCCNWAGRWKLRL